MKKQIQIGDWVHSYSKGIYRVEKIFETYYDELHSYNGTLYKHNIGDRQEHSTIVSKRLFNSSLKKSLGYETCSEDFVKPLNKKELAQVEKALAQNPKLLAELDNFEVPPIETINNTQLQIDTEADLNLTLQLVAFIGTGKTFLEIKTEMERLDIVRLKPKTFGNYRFQFINYDNEQTDKRRIWRDAKLTQKD
ncbi:hypothetical protein [Pedobacter agri]|uniref:hypothetical protein n=1 Tax=Pedobacter agri TaxID=454586 RepID=UPI002930D3E9|nr:hypothetical protein [Pedobacter agri]